MGIAKNLWGDLPDIQDVRPPALILREQATALGELTKGVLSAYVDVSRQRDNISLELRITAPALADYEYVVLHAFHKMNMYPVFVRSNTETEPIECGDEAQFESAIGAILQSSSVRRAVASLLAQSKATGQ
jgi:hypothetical protein